MASRFMAMSREAYLRQCFWFVSVLRTIMEDLAGDPPRRRPLPRHRNACPQLILLFPLMGSVNTPSPLLWQQVWEEQEKWMAEPYNGWGIEEYDMCDVLHILFLFRGSLCCWKNERWKLKNAASCVSHGYLCSSGLPL